MHGARKREREGRERKRENSEENENESGESVPDRRARMKEWGEIGAREGGESKGRRAPKEEVGGANPMGALSRPTYLRAEGRKEGRMEERECFPTDRQTTTD